MRTTISYQNEIKEKYQRDKESGKLRGNLYKLTPSNVRKACLNICDNTLSKADKAILENFFNVRTGDSIRDVIKKYDLDKLKPICSFLEEKSGSLQSTDALELIALIIDFSPRPYNLYTVGEQTQNVKEKDGGPIIKDPIDPINVDDKDKNGPDRNKFLFFVKKNKIALIVFASIITAFLIYNSLTIQRWMVWQKDHYVKTKFDTEKLSSGELKLYNPDRIEHFFQVQPDCDYSFFKEDGNENLWYGKNANKELEFFTDMGLHPETGKTLKAITEYMVVKHICPSYGE